MRLWSRAGFTALAPFFVCALGSQGFSTCASMPAHSIRNPRFHIHEDRQTVSLSFPVFSSIRETPFLQREPEQSRTRPFFPLVTDEGLVGLPVVKCREPIYASSNFDGSCVRVLNHYQCSQLFTKQYGRGL